MKKLISLFQIILVSGLIFWFLFYKLGDWPFRVWDEARVITSAYEMTQNHKFLTPTVDGGIDMWNCKPPLMVWAEALSIKIFGFCEWSARLPAAFCGMLTIIMVAVFIKKEKWNPWVWVVPVIVLCTSAGLIGYHAARFGEYDAMLTLFTTAYLLSFFNYTESVGLKRNKYLLLFFVFLVLACLTKGVAGLLFTPALAVYTMVRRQLYSTLHNKYLYLGLLIFFVFVPGYYLLREHFNPGYIQAVWENELGGRFNTTLGGTPTPADLYVWAIRRFQFSTWIWALYVSLFSMWFLRGHRTFRLMVFCWLSALLFLIVISKSATKMLWYDLPLFPLFATIVSIVIFQLAEIAAQLPFISREIAIVILICIFSIQPLWESYNFLHFQGDDLSKDNFYAVSHYFRRAMRGKRNLDGAIYLSCCYNIQWRLYVKMLNDVGGDVIDHPYLDASKFKPGDRIIANQDEMKTYIETNYGYSVVEDYYGVKNYLITSVK